MWVYIIFYFSFYSLCLSFSFSFPSLCSELLLVLHFPNFLLLCFPLILSSHFLFLVFFIVFFIFIRLTNIGFINRANLLHQAICSFFSHKVRNNIFRLDEIISHNLYHIFGENYSEIAVLSSADRRTKVYL